MTSDEQDQPTKDSARLGVPEAEVAPASASLEVGDSGQNLPSESQAVADPTLSGRLPRSSSGVTWVVLACGLVLLVVILIFILENPKSVRARFFTVGWKIPLGVDLLFAAVLGGLVVFLIGSVRIVVLRRLARRRRRAS